MYFEDVNDNYVITSETSQIMVNKDIHFLFSKQYVTNQVYFFTFLQIKCNSIKKTYSKATVEEHPFFRINIVLTSMLLIIYQFLWMPYELYLCENCKTKHFMWIWERFTGNFDLRLVNILNFVFQVAIMLFSTNQKMQNLTASV